METSPHSKHETVGAQKEPLELPCPILGEPLLQRQLETIMPVQLLVATLDFPFPCRVPIRGQLQEEEEELPILGHKAELAVLHQTLGELEECLEWRACHNPTWSR